MASEQINHIPFIHDKINIVGSVKKYMRKVLRFVIKWLKDWENLIFWFLVLLVITGWIVPIVLPEFRVIREIGIPSTSFGVIAGSIATVSGALVGILVAAMLFLAQYASANFADIKARLVSEEQWLNAKLRDGKILTNNITTALNDLGQLCDTTVMMFPREFKCEEVTDSIKKVTAMIRKYYKTLKYRVNKIEKESSEIEASRKRRRNEALKRLKSRLDSFVTMLLLGEEVLHHLQVLSVTSTRVKLISLLPEVIESLKRYITSFVLILIVALISLFLCTIVFPNGYLIPNYFRMVFAAQLILFLSITLRYLVKLISVNWKVIRLTIGLERTNLIRYCNDSN